MLKSWRAGRQTRRDAETLYTQAVTAARHPALYGTYGIPDSLDGRFDAVLLHVFLLLDALAGIGPDTLDLQRALQEVMVEDLDQSVREAGAGDLSVGRHVQTMAGACRGRLMAYAEAARENDAAVLQTVLARNVYRQDSHPDAAKLTGYVIERRDALSALNLPAILRGEGFPQLG